MGPDQRRLERQSSMPSERPKSNYGNYPMRYFKISAYGATPQGSGPKTVCEGPKARPIVDDGRPQCFSDLVIHGDFRWTSVRRTTIYRRLSSD